ncbi:MAG: fused MFS/spermidine synthase, partial [Gemmatimonadota bacterium]
MLYVFSATLFVGAFLLFWIQPLFTKAVLPLLGGSANVWNTALVFFQAGLLAGYGYVHATSRLLSPRKQVGLHLALLVGAVFFLPPAVPDWEPPASELPIPWLLSLFGTGIGVPFLAIAATAPLLQRWLTRTSHVAASDPYFLYAASNAGSIFALLTFPSLLEPFLGLSRQRAYWSGLFGALVLLVLCAAWLALRAEGSDVEGEADRNPRTTAPSRAARLRWLLLAFAPSSLLLGVTTHITTDVAATPLFWVVPLALYLLTYVIAFSRRPAIRHRTALAAQPFFVILLAVVLSGQLFLWAAIAAHLATFFVVALVCHGELARRRPHTRFLTEFYLWIAGGGLLGGIFNAILAPVLFPRVWEYPLMLVVACTLRPILGTGAGSGAPAGESETPVPGLAWRDVGFPAALLAGGWFLGRLASHPTPWQRPVLVLLLVATGTAVYAFRRRPIRFGLGVGALLLVLGTAIRSPFEVLESRRSFYGVYTIRSDANHEAYFLFHGTTVHGAALRDSAGWREPLAYYHPNGPLGSILGDDPGARRIGVVGLGVGSASCYARPGQQWTLFEIDPAVETLARDTRYFHYLQECGEGMRVVLRDARLALQEVPNGRFDRLIGDAFSSDAIPVHLLTKEAVDLYLAKTAPDGLLAFHITNRHMDLEPV